ncbi:MAG: hypothetical protein AAGC44_11115 [Planctomycetota bacterium]
MAQLILMLMGGYVLVGTVLGILFVFKGISRVDPAADGGPTVFRMLILPGVVGLWPVMLRKWLAVRKGGSA